MSVDHKKQFKELYGPKDDAKNTFDQIYEIYLSDPRKIDSAKMKTILRYPVRKKA